MFVLRFRSGYCHILEVILLSLRDGKKSHSRRDDEGGFLLCLIPDYERVMIPLDNVQV